MCMCSVKGLVLGTLNTSEKCRIYDLDDIGSLNLYRSYCSMYDLDDIGSINLYRPYCRMYDLDDSGSINVAEMTNIIATMDELEGESMRLGLNSPANRFEVQHYALYL